MENNQQNPAQASDTKATDAEAKLAAYFRQRHSGELAKLPPAPKPVEIDTRGLVPMSPEAIAEREQRTIRRAVAREQMERDGWLAQLSHGAGSRYANCTFDNFKTVNDRQREAVWTCQNYIEVMRDAWQCGGLVFYGPVGTGKDHLAFAVAATIIRELGKRADWLKCQDWFGKIRDNMDRDVSEASVVAALASPELLVISDPLPPMGALTQHQATMLYRVVEARYSRARPTIVTVNVKDDAEADLRMGVATWDRLTHDAYKVFCNWPTHRTAAKKVNC
jgi:DNA replication protein DnaC